MEVKQGITICEGIASGEIFVYEKQAHGSPGASPARPPQEECERYESALKAVLAQQEDLRVRAAAHAGGDASAIFEIHAMLLEDEDFNAEIFRQIQREGKTCEEAVDAAGKLFATRFSGMDDPYFRERATDFTDIAGNLLDVLHDKQDALAEIDRPVIVVAKDLTPSETVRIPRQHILAFVTEKGSQSSHAAILARMMGIPALTGISADPAWHGLPGIVNGISGELAIRPNAHARQVADTLLRESGQEKMRLEAQRGRATQTRGGKKVKLCANIARPEDADAAMQNDAEGVGLFRTEFLFLGRNTVPTEDEQFQAYLAVAQKMQNRPVVIRTMDIGADKKAESLALEPEENPALGYRAIRISLDRPALFLTQLRAILRAGAFGKLRIMLPMITSMQEILRAKALLAQAKEQLRARGLALGLDQFGIMIETPAAAIICDELAKEVDFFSIGTNDLTQYTLAADRQNAKLDAWIDPHHPALLRLIEHTIQSGHREGCWVGICGELAADTELTETFIRMGIDELSVSPSHILPMRAAIARLD
ncbi:MAG: phosphoenolpyruvate--protein phosphotransferase [Candidatus Pelethousia sp.]|nr:phosphoenolpyruvate--protein phosphotransferase [Candidatus Pelethousia sp.]